VTLAWRPASAADAATIAANARTVLGDYAETQAVYAERIALAPDGCFVLAEGARIAGHFLSHPWHRGAAPAMNAMLGALPVDADCWYVHEAALLTEARGTGAVEPMLAEVAMAASSRGMSVLALVAVGGADRYWQRLGFTATAIGATGFGAASVYMERRIG
jgi:predicted N-acetyltransferase YhbS